MNKPKSLNLRNKQSRGEIKRHTNNRYTMRLEWGFMKQLPFELNLDGLLSGCKQQRRTLAKWRGEESIENCGCSSWTELKTEPARAQALWIDVSGPAVDFSWSMVGWVNANAIRLGRSSQDTHLKVTGPGSHDLGPVSTSWPVQSQGSHSLKEDHKLKTKSSGSDVVLHKPQTDRQKEQLSKDREVGK